MSVYDTIREGIAEDWRKAQAYDAMKKEVADYKEVLAYARQKLLELAKFPCIHDRENRNEYCSGCPCSAIGSDKDPRLDYAASKKLCTLSRNYPQ